MLLFGMENIVVFKKVLILLFRGSLIVVKRRLNFIKTYWESQQPEKSFVFTAHLQPIKVMLTLWLIFSSKTKSQNNWWKHSLNDLFLVGRGFRDSIDDLIKAKYEVLMPSFIDKGSKQLSDKQANAQNLERLLSVCLDAYKANLHIFQHRFQIAHSS